jgi:hypothetical protein
MAGSTKARLERLEAATDTSDEVLLVSWMGGGVIAANYGGVRVLREDAEPLGTLLSRVP